jgi:hypothetical protein
MWSANKVEGFTSAIKRQGIKRSPPTPHKDSPLNPPQGDLKIVLIIDIEYIFVT